MVTGDSAAHEQLVEEASAEVRRAFLWFGSFAAYFATTVAATTHENLLRGTAVKLPLLNVDLPIVGFYIIGPLTFLLLHAWLMFQLFLLASRSRALISAVGPRQAQLLGSSFPPTQYLLGGLGAFRPLFGVAIWLAIILAPALILCFVQVRFLPYHARSITGFHIGLVVLDTVMALILWCLTIRGLAMRERHRELDLEVPSPQRAPRLLAIAGYTGLGAFAVLTLWFSWSVAALPVDEAAAPRELAPVAGRPTDPCAPEPVQEVVEATPTPSPNPPDNPAFCTSLLRLQDYPFRYEPPPAYEGAPPRRMLCLSYLLFEAPTTPLDMRRNLVVRGKSFAPAATSPRLGTGFDLRGRDLRFADFTGSDFTAADMRGADLYGAELENTILRAADLGDVSAREFDLCEGFTSVDGNGNQFCRTVARAANLQRAELQDARLRKIDLRLARLGDADLTGADLVEADATGAGMPGANLSAGRLRGIRLDDSGMREVRATGADLTCARARRADLSAADLSTATAGRVRLADANLDEARLVGTYMPRADLTGASLGGAFLEGVDLRASKLVGAKWSVDPYGPAELGLVDLRGARLDLGALQEALLGPDVILPGSEVAPEAPVPAAFDAALVALLEPLLARPDYRSGVIGRLESERNDTCGVRPYQATLANALLAGACERDDRFTPAEWWVLQIARRASLAGARKPPAAEAEALTRCVTGPPPSPGACDPQPWVPVDTPATASP
ncbi:MAG: pentapeptide repeat-containing protein [Geminicoccaceae bacterium]